MSAPSKWHLNWTGATATAPEGDGRPWGDGSAMAGRQAKGLDPWDEDSSVKVMFGLEAMSAMADALQAIVGEGAKASKKFDTTARKWLNGHVYIAHWRFNCLRDLSTTNAWGTNSWGSAKTATLDQTAIGLAFKLMQAGIQVRLMLWHPTWLGEIIGGFEPHVLDHFYAAQLFEAENLRLMDKFGAKAASDPPLGVVALDMRTAELKSAAHHQKIMIVRTPWRDVGFSGGVDLAYTRRDAPVLGGDWQSGAGGGMLAPSAGWPQEDGNHVQYDSLKKVKAPKKKQSEDLPAKIYGADRQMWHDQHLQLEGDVVPTLESNFVERWSLSGRAFDLSKPMNAFANQVIFSTPKAIKDGAVVPLPEPRPIVRTALTAVAPRKPRVQMWRTFPLHPKRESGRHQRGEFTAMYGISEACRQATELIWIFDQYFWSRPLGRLLHRRLVETPSLHLVIVLPPHADVLTDYAHRARKFALSEILGNPKVPAIASRVAVYSTWRRPTPERGIYVHAKVQMYDAELLVCGSANLNRRSFLCDTEIAFAVDDTVLLDAHQRKLWSYVLPGPFPTLDRTRPGWGKVLFDEIARASGVSKVGDVSPDSRLILDPWELENSKLPNGAKRSMSGAGRIYRKLYREGLDPSSVDLAVESPVAVGSKRTRPADLADIVARLEREFTIENGKAVFPWRTTDAKR